MRKTLLALLLVSQSALADLLLKDEGMTQGPVLSLNCNSGGVVCSRSGAAGTITISRRTTKQVKRRARDMLGTARATK